MGGSSPLRYLRAAGVTAVMLALAAGAHVVGGGVLPASWLVVALGALLLVPVTALSGRRLTLPGLLALATVSQISLHGAFTSLTPLRGCAPTTAGYSPDFQAGHTSEHRPHQQAVTCSPSLAGTDAGADIDAGMGMGSIGELPQDHAHVLEHPSATLMVLAHLIGTLLVSIVLARSDAALSRLLTWITPRLPASSPAPFPVRSVDLPAWADLTRPHPAPYFHAGGVRGPPVPHPGSAS